MTLEAFLGRVLGIIETTGIPCMLTGSIAVAYYAEPRATRDLDVVIAVSSDDMEELLRRLDAEGFYVSHEAAREALRRQGRDYIERWVDELDLGRQWGILLEEARQEEGG